MRGRGQGFSQGINIPKAPPPESSHWFWNPSRAGITGAPDDFAAKLKAIDPDLRITWDCYQERWLLWAVNHRVQSKLCTGWSLLFPIRYADGSYMPLDERVFARLYEASAQRWDNAKTYFDAIEREWERDRDKAKKNRNDDVKHSAGDYYDYMKIKNYGSGSKFANHFS